MGERFSVNQKNTLKVIRVRFNSFRNFCPKKLTQMMSKFSKRRNFHSIYFIVVELLDELKDILFTFTYMKSEKISTYMFSMTE